LVQPLHPRISPVPIGPFNCLRDIHNRGLTFPTPFRVSLQSLDVAPQKGKDIELAADCNDETVPIWHAAAHQALSCALSFFFSFRQTSCPILPFFKLK
jgi:hypothetical protein